MNQKEYERAHLIITEFDKEDVITTSQMDPPNTDPYEGGFFP